jgi:phage tail tape-measure protein
LGLELSVDVTEGLELELEGGVCALDKVSFGVSGRLRFCDGARLAVEVSGKLCFGVRGKVAFCVSVRLGFGENVELGSADGDGGGFSVWDGVGSGDIERVGLGVAGGHVPHNTISGAKIVIVGTHFVTLKVATAAE